MLNNYPPGAANDPKAPWNEPPLREVTVEVGVELGTLVTIEVFEDGEENFKDQLKQALVKKFNIDNDDVVLNNLNVYNIQ